jgi:hypothetical protein
MKDVMLCLRKKNPIGGLVDPNSKSLQHGSSRSGE